MMERSSRNRSSFGAPLVWSVVIIVVLGVAIVWQGSALRDAVGRVLVGADDAAYAAVPHAVLVERLKTAEQEVLNTRYQALLYQSIHDDYAALRAEVGARPPEAFMTARVVARPPRTHYDVLLLAAGSNDGVVVGDLVSVSDILLGTVTEVTPGTATVALFSGAGVSRDIELGDPQAIVVLHGQGGGAFDALVPASVAVTPGDLAFDEATGMLVAILADVTHAPTDVAATVRLALPVSLSTLRDVSITHHTDAR